MNATKSNESYFEIGDTIAKKRDGKEEMTTEEMNFWVKGVLAGASSSIISRKLEGMSEIPAVSSAQLGAWLMAVVINGLSAKETADLTKAMLNNGQIFDWPSDWKSSLVDKHSIGGVGDKVNTSFKSVFFIKALKWLIVRNKIYKHPILILLGVFGFGSRFSCLWKEGSYDKW